MTPQKTIVIVSALNEELLYLLNKKELNWSSLWDTYNKIQINEGHINNCRIIAVDASGMLTLRI